MAIIDIDRHILSEIMDIQRKLRESGTRFFKQWHKVMEVRDKTDALLFHHPMCNQLPEECIFRQAELKKLRDSIFRASDKASITVQTMTALYSKQEALLTHLVSLVREVDTGRGLESNEERKGEGQGTGTHRDIRATELDTKPNREHSDETDETAGGISKGST